MVGKHQGCLTSHRSHEREMTRKCGCVCEKKPCMILGRDVTQIYTSHLFFFIQAETFPVVPLSVHELYMNIVSLCS